MPERPRTEPVQRHTAQPKPTLGKRIAAIQGLRGFAALSVILFHCYEHVVDKGIMQPLPDGLLSRSIIALGGYSVCLFFCISGYLISQSLLRHANVKEFLRNRVARIYPLFGTIHVAIFTLGVAFGYEGLGALLNSPTQYFEQFFSNFLLLPGVFPLPIAQKNAWSLSYEAAFYLLACLAYVAFAKRRTHLTLSAFAGFMFTLGSVLFLVALAPSRFFVVGAFWFWFVHCGWTIPRIVRFAPFGLICWLAGLLSFGYSLDGALVFALLAFASVIAEAGWFARLLLSRPFRYLGKISYSLYLVHPFAVHWMRVLSVRLGATAHVPVVPMFVFCSICASVLVAHFTYELIEIRLTRRLFPKGSTS